MPPDLFTVRQVLGDEFTPSRIARSLSLSAQRRPLAIHADLIQPGCIMTNTTTSPATTTCPILDRETDVTPTPYQRDEWKIVKCQETGFVFLADPPDYSQLETEFAWEKTSEQERTRRETEQPIASRISNIAKGIKRTVNPGRKKIARLANQFLAQQQNSEPTTILDIGCGGGCLLVNIAKESTRVGRDIRPLGIEVSEQLAINSRKLLGPYGGDVIMASAIDGAAAMAPQSVGLVLMSSFLEHECQPLRLLRNLREALTPDGAIILKVPNFDCWNRVVRKERWCGFRYPDHVNYFTPTTLQRLAKEAGLEMLPQPLSNRSPISDNMYATLKLGTASVAKRSAA